MNYSFQVAYLNTIRPKKLIPENIIQDLYNNKSFSSLVSIIKEYNYNISNFKETELLNAYNFESIITNELLDTLNLIDTLLYENHRWIVDWLKNYFIDNNFTGIKVLISFLENSYLKFKKLNSKLLEELINLVIDFENIKIFLSYSLLKDVSLKDIKFIKFGSFSELLLKELSFSVDNLNNILSFSKYHKLKVYSQPVKENFHYYLNHYLKELSWKSKFCYFTIEPIVFYFLDKLFETQRIKEIYYDIKLS